jgi:hypothetical protein
MCEEGEGMDFPAATVCGGCLTVNSECFRGADREEGRKYLHVGTKSAAVASAPQMVTSSTQGGISRAIMSNKGMNLLCMSPTLWWHAQRRLASSLKSQATTIEVRDNDRPEEKEEKKKEKGKEHKRKGK